MARMLKAPPPPPPPSSSLSPLHVPDYSLPSSSRIPKVMIAGVAGFIVTTTAIFYLCKWLFFKKCCDSSSSSSSSSDSGISTTSIDEEVARDDRKPLQGLGKRIGVAIPTVSYAELVQLRGGKDDDSELCAVCLTEFSKSEGSRIKVLPKCSHAFHCSCIDVWLASHASCPVCRATLVAMPVVVVDSASHVQEQHQEDEQQHGGPS